MSTEPIHTLREMATFPIGTVFVSTTGVTYRIKDEYGTKIAIAQSVGGTTMETKTVLDETVTDVPFANSYELRPVWVPHTSSEM